MTGSNAAATANHGNPHRKHPRARGVVRLDRVAARIDTATTVEWSAEIKAEIERTRDMVRADIVRRATEGDASAAKLLMTMF